MYNAHVFIHIFYEYYRIEIYDYFREKKVVTYIICIADVNE